MVEHAPILPRISDPAMARPEFSGNVDTGNSNDNVNALIGNEVNQTTEVSNVDKVKGLFTSVASNKMIVLIIVLIIIVIGIVAYIVVNKKSDNVEKKTIMGRFKRESSPREGSSLPVPNTDTVTNKHPPQQVAATTPDQIAKVHRQRQRAQQQNKQPEVEEPSEGTTKHHQMVAKSAEELLAMRQKNRKMQNKPSVSATPQTQQPQQTQQTQTMQSPTRRVPNQVEEFDLHEYLKSNAEQPLSKSDDIDDAIASAINVNFAAAAENAGDDEHVSVGTNSTTDVNNVETSNIIDAYDNDTYDNDNNDNNDNNSNDFSNGSQSDDLDEQSSGKCTKMLNNGRYCRNKATRGDKCTIHSKR